jgi:hypothetical protein
VQNPPLRLKHVWAIRTKLQIEQRVRDLAMFNLAIDSKLRGCDVDRQGRDRAPAAPPRGRYSHHTRRAGSASGVCFHPTGLSTPAAARRVPGSLSFPARYQPRGAAQRRGGLHDLRLHDLRHTTATRVLRKTGNLVAAQKALGQRRISTTQRCAHMLAEDVRAALDAAAPVVAPVAESPAESPVQATGNGRKAG